MTTPLPPLPNLRGGIVKHTILGELYDRLQVEQRMVAYATQARADLEAENKRLREALKAILQSWDNNTFDRERFVKSEIGDYWSPASAMVNSETIAAARAALEKQP